MGINDRAKIYFVVDSGTQYPGITSRIIPRTEICGRAIICPL